MSASSSSKVKAKQTSDEILSELFSSIAPKGEDGEAEEGEANSASSPSGSEEETYKKAKKSKKAKKEKKKKKKKEKDRDKDKEKDKEKKRKLSSPKRKVRPLSPPAKPGGLQSSLDEWDISSRKQSREFSPKRHRHDDSGHGRHIKEERDSHHRRSDNDHHHQREGNWPDSDRGRNNRNHEEHRGGGGNHWHENDRNSRPSTDRRSNQDFDRNHQNRHEDSRGDRHQSRDHYDQRNHRGGGHDQRRDQRSDHQRSSRSTRQDEQRPPKRSSSNNEDSFWDTRWEGMEMQKKADALEKRGKHFLDEKRDREAKIAAEKAKKRERSESPESEELKRLKRMKEIQDLVVKEEEKYVAEPLDPSLFVWDDKVKMWKRRPEGSKPGDKTYEDELKERMEEQFNEGKRTSPTETNDIKKEIKEEVNEEDDEKTDSEKSKKPSKPDSEKSKKPSKPEKGPAKLSKKEEAKMSLDEIEEIRKKREKFKEGKNKNDDKKNSEEKEDGEVNSDDEENNAKRSSKSSKSRNYRTRSRSRSRDRDSRSHTKSRRDSRSVSKDYRDKDRGRRGHRSRSRDRYNHRDRSRSRERQSFRRERDRSGSRSHDRHFTSFKSSTDGRGYRERDRDRVRDRYNSRSYRGGRGGRSRSRSPKDSFRGSRSEIDKAKLLAIAKKNAVKLLTSDNLMGMDHDRLIAIKSGGQSLRQLTDFCREIVAKGITDEFDEDDDILYGNDKNDDDLHHPFAVKDRAVPNPFSSSGVAAEKLTPAMKSAAMSHRMIEFPVSSGNSHRVKEVDVKEVKQKPPKVDTEVKLAIEDKSAEEKEAEKIDKINQANPLGIIMFGGAVPEKPLALTLQEKEKETEKKAETDEKIEEKTDNFLAELKSKSSFKDPLLPQFRAKPVDSVFDPVAEPNQDISSIVKQRLDAQKKLEANPSDSEALAKLYEAQKEMAKWAESKNKPGQFTGHTGAKILTHAELSTGIQAWAKQEQFSNAKKVQGGFGEFLLKKMGWCEGDGLGKTRSGDVDPLTLDIKMDKKGLASAEEDVKNKRRSGGGITLTACKDLSHKHPVSGLMELSTKRKWGPPNFVQLFDVGPPHKKQYIFKVVVNGTDYQPTVASDNKKKAKADAATVALIQMGLLPKDPNNPL